MLAANQSSGTRKIFEYNRQKITVHDGVQWSFLGNPSSALLAFEYSKGLLAYANGAWVPAARQGNLAADINIKGSVEIGHDSTLLVTLMRGLYILHHDTITKFTSPGIESITDQNIYGAAMLAPDCIALITNLTGCIIIDKQGQIVQRISKKEGVQNNNVLSMMLDKDRNLWLGLDNGIDLVLYNNAIKNIFPEREDKNAGYVSMVHNGRLYLGLASGAYAIPLDNRQSFRQAKSGTHS